MSSASPSAVVGAPQNNDETANTKPPAPFPPPKTDKPRPHVCTTCQRGFARLEHLKRHERSHTKEKPFECPQCTRCFARRDLLLRHQQKLHQTTTPSSRPRNRRESAAGAPPGASRLRKNSVAGPQAAAVAAAATTMRPRANTISHVDAVHMQQMMGSANASVARLPPTHSRHPSLIGLPVHNMDNSYGGMSAALGHRGMSLGLPKLETNSLNPMDFSGGLRTAPPLAIYNNQSEFDFEGMLFGPSTGSTINPNALHYNESAQSLTLDAMSPYSYHGMPAPMSANPHHQDDSFDWLTGFEHQMSFTDGVNESAIDGSSPSALSTTSQSGISDVMLDGSNNNHGGSTGASSMWQPGIMGPPQMNHPFSLDLSGSVFPDLMNGAPVSPQPPQKNMGDAYFSTPPPSLSSVSPSMMSGMTAQQQQQQIMNQQQNMNQAINYGVGPETPSSMNGITHGTTTLPVSTITDSTRNAILGALSSTPSTHLSGRQSFSVPNQSAKSSLLQSAASANTTDNSSTLPSTADLQRYVGAYLRYFHPHLPFLHLPTLSFEISSKSAGGRNDGIGGSGCLILSMAAIGALYEMEHKQSFELFDKAKKMIQLYLDERRKANVRKADFRRPSSAEAGHRQQGENVVDTPLWLVQAMLLNIIYGHNCGDATLALNASRHTAALMGLAKGAELLQPVRIDGSEDQNMSMGDGQNENDGHEQWLRWKTMEERKRTLYTVFILSSLLVSAYNHTPNLTNSEVLLDLPCDEEFFAADSSAAFQALGGITAANHNRMSFHEALGDLLRTNEKQRRMSMSNGAQQHQQSSHGSGMQDSNLKPSTFGCLILINALHNYIWETRQRHHNKIWTNEETEKMHRHIEPALKAWQTAWSSNPQHSLERPNPYGGGPMSADAIPLLDLAYVRLFVNLSRSKDKFWERNWDGMADELARGNEIIQHAEHSPASIAETSRTDQSDMSANSSALVDTPATETSSPDFSSAKLDSMQPNQVNLGSMQQAPMQTQPLLGSSISRRERHLRKAAFYAADSLSMSDKLGVTFADYTSRELPLQSALCAFDCAQVLAEWVATLQDRVGRYLGILGQDDVDFTQVPGIMLLEDDDVRLLQKIQDVLSAAELKMSMEMAASGNMNGMMDGRLPLMKDHAGYAAKILGVTAYMLEKAAVWPITRLMATCLESHADKMRARAERSVTAME